MAQADGGVDVFWRGTDNHLWQLGYRPGQGWFGARNLGGQLASNPAPAVTSPGTVDVFWQGTDGHLWQAGDMPGSGWSGAASRGGSLASNPAPVASAPGTVDVFFKGTNGNLWHVFRVGGGAWSTPPGPPSLGMGVLGSGPWATAPAQRRDRRVLARIGRQPPVARRLPPGHRLVRLRRNLGGDLYPVS